MNSITYLRAYNTEKITETNEQLVVAAKKGDKVAKDRLICKNIPAIISLAKRYKNVDDFIGVGVFGLVRAISGYNPDKGTKFITYATRKIKSAMQVENHNTKKLKTVPLATDFDIQDNHYSLFKEITDREDFERINILLDERERYILNNREYKTLRELANELGLSKEGVRYIENKANEKLKNML